MADLTGNPAAAVDLVMPDINEDGSTPASPGEMNSRYQQLLDNDARLANDVSSALAGEIASVAAHKAMGLAYMEVNALGEIDTDPPGGLAGWSVAHTPGSGVYRVTYPAGYWLADTPFVALATPFRVSSSVAIAQVNAMNTPLLWVEISMFDASVTPPTPGDYGFTLLMIGPPA